MELRHLHIYRDRMPSRDLTKVRDILGIPSWHIMAMGVYMYKSAAASAGLQGGFPWPILWTPHSCVCMCAYVYIYLCIFD